MLISSVINELAYAYLVIDFMCIYVFVCFLINVNLEVRYLYLEDVLLASV